MTAVFVRTCVFEGTTYTILTAKKFNHSVHNITPELLTKSFMKVIPIIVGQEDLFQISFAISINRVVNHPFNMMVFFRFSNSI